MDFLVVRKQLPYPRAVYGSPFLVQPETPPPHTHTKQKLWGGEGVSSCSLSQGRAPSWYRQENQGWGIQLVQGHLASKLWS